MKKQATIAALVAFALAGTMALSACGNATTSSAPSTASSEQKKDDKKADTESSHEEIPIGHDVEVGPLNVSMVFFQPVDMEPAGMGLSAADSSFHLEADIKALKDNKLGYAPGEYVPDLTVTYQIIDKKDNKDVVSGTFMQMNADDGPHYGANVKLDQAGDYTVKLTIASPAEKGWALHVDKATGVEGRFWTKPLVVETDWKYTPQKW